MIENELTFVVKNMPDLTGLGHNDIEQHYLSEGAEPVRIRKIGRRFELTKKMDLAKSDLSRREEINLPLTEGEFERLKTLSLRHIQKTRYYAPLPEGLMAELDVYHGDLEGLALVEVEFIDETVRASFVPPPWFGRDISQEAWSRNHNLAAMTLEQVKKYLE
ncbi:MAG: adenylate cyclase [Patescibacteria group bacterium]|nr:adenylate cyclase [Patescibacteria group bacterium]